MCIGKLILSPAQSSVEVKPVPLLIEALQRIGFCGASLPGDTNTRFLVGARFLQLIIFLGCSPSIRLAPETEDSIAFCHILFSGPYKQNRFISGSNTVSPACPRCRAKNPDWRQMIAAWRDDRRDDTWLCPQCGANSFVTQLNWRKSAGFGRLFIEVVNVFPGEAVPGEELLNTLQTVVASDWSYFYVMQDTG